MHIVAILIALLVVGGVAVYLVKRAKAPAAASATTVAVGSSQSATDPNPTNKV